MVLTRERLSRACGRTGQPEKCEASGLHIHCITVKPFILAAPKVSDLGQLPNVNTFKISKFARFLSLYHQDQLFGCP